MDSTANNSRPSIARTVAWGMWLTGALFYAYQYILRVSPSIMMNDIMQRFNVDSSAFGQFSGVYYLGYALMHLPLGIMLDRFGPKRVMPICILLTVIGTLPIALADKWIYPLIGRFLIGVGSSAAILGTFKIIHMSFASNKFTRMLSFAVTIGLIGAIYGGAPVNYMCEAFGYKAVNLIFGAIGIVLAIGAYVMIPNITTPLSTSILKDVKKVVSSVKVLAICLLAGLMVGPLEGFADVWGKEYLQNVYGFDSNLAAALPSTIFIGMCFGAPVLTFISAKLKNDLVTIFSTGLVMSACFFLLLTGSLSATMISFIFMIVGICCAYQIIAIFKASSYVPENITSLTTALANMIIMIFGYVFHSVIGMVNGMGNIYNPNTSLTYSIAIIPTACLVGALGIMLIYWQEHNSEELSLSKTA